MHRLQLSTAVLLLTLTGVLFAWRADRNTYVSSNNDDRQSAARTILTPVAFQGPSNTERDARQAEAFEKLIADYKVKRDTDAGHPDQLCDLDFMMCRPLSDFKEFIAVANGPTASAPLEPGLWTIWHDRDPENNPEEYVYYSWMNYGPTFSATGLPTYELAIAVHKDYICGYQFALWSR